MGSKSDTIHVNAPAPAVMEAAILALQQTGAKIGSVDRNALIISGSKGFSFTSYGEKISVQVESVGAAASVVHITSKPVMPLNILDFGKNARNVSAFRSALEAAILPTR